MYDIIIIGKGPAGISAALYTVRANLKTLVVGSGIGGLETAEKIDNYYGFPDGISGKELQQRGVDQVQVLGCDVLDEEVLSVVKLDSFTVKTNRGEYEGKQILLTTGKSRVKTKIKGIDAFLGRGVSMCAVCDGFFYRGKRLVVLGNANYAIAETEELTRFSQDITICTNGRKPAWEGTVPEGVKVDTRTVAEVSGDAKVSRLVFEDGEIFELDGIFIAEGTASAIDFAAKMGILTEGTNIVVDENFKTNVDGVFAAGDCIGGFLQVSKAVSDGALAARMMIKGSRK
ncbi:FAD-dependent oxidoreductase [Hydrogenoanaerobacterium sp.]|uniref:NAD(P)/FAD-dependent oxidoreductase n=1 Tax=Hydrogenoanaerobacterium sp. TaxID=2953763 RepID=UPI00289EC55D|nr:FAD-dependent oxidoreductase [Hydrogenoanaerobacterium sp.]